jgi:uncharacterized protein YwqG
MDRLAAIDAVRSSALPNHADAIIAALRPSIRIRASNDPATATGPVSKFAGHPYLPRGMNWPTWNSSPYHAWWIAWVERRLASRKGSPTALGEAADRHRAAAAKNPMPLGFIAQIRLDDLGSAAAAIDLPNEGSLLFFYDIETSAAGFVPEARGSSRVIWVRENDLVPAAPPDAIAAALSPCALAFELEYTLPGHLDALPAEAATREAYGDLWGRIQGKAPLHRLGGHPEEVQSGLFRTCQLAANGVACGSPEDGRTEQVRQLAPGAADWRLLLQVDTDDHGHGWMWGDSGTLYFCIREEDLRARRFDRIWAEEQCC